MKQPPTSANATGCLLFVATSPAIPCQEESWPDYRGPRHDGHSDATGLPLEWDEAHNVSWKTPIHGRAWSSPVVVDEEVWVTSATPDGHKLFFLCVDVETGEIVLDERLFQIDEPQYVHAFNTYASPAPVIDGGAVYVSFGPAALIHVDGLIYAFSQEGKGVILRPGTEFDLLGENHLDGGFMASRGDVSPLTDPAIRNTPLSDP